MVRIVPTYTVHPVPTSEVAEQRAAYTALLRGLGQGTFDEIEAALAEREEAAPESSLDPQAVERLRQRLAVKQKG